MKKKIAVLTASVLLAAVWTAGCFKSSGNTWDGSENSIYVADDLSVQSAMIYTSEKDNELYSADGLAEFVREQIASYNEEQGAAAESENTDGSAKLPAALVRFSEENGDDTHTVTSLQVLDTEETRLPDMSYKTPAGKDADIRKAAAKDSHMVLTEGSAKVYTEGKILYVTDGVEVTSDYSAVTPEGTGCIIFK